MAALMNSKVSAVSAFSSKASKKSVRAVSCKASARQEAIDRRAALSALAFLPAAFYAPKALALIPDEEDEEMVERAKANRKAKLQQDRQVAREFLNTEGIKDIADSKDLAPVQQAVFKLAECGSQLESGDVKAASSTLSGSWVSSFSTASKGLSTTDSAKEGAQSVADGLDALKAVASKGDLAGTKRQFVAVVSSVESWAAGAGLAGSLKGL
jgi:hypothetical protein